MRLENGAFRPGRFVSAQGAHEGRGVGGQRADVSGISAADAFGQDEGYEMMSSRTSGTSWFTRVQQFCNE